MICDALIDETWRAVGSSLGSWTPDPGDPKDLDRLADDVQGAVPGVAGLAAVELRAAVCLCWLGPARAGPPPAALHADLLRLVADHEPNESARPDRVMEFAIALGCGWGRQVVAGHGTWDQRWEGGLRALARAIRDAARTTFSYLANAVLGFGAAETADVDDLADNLALSLALDGRVAGGREETITFRSTTDGLEVDGLRRPVVGVPPGSRIVLDAVGDCSLGLGPKDLDLPARSRIKLLARDDDAWVEAGGHPRQVVSFGDRILAGPADALLLRECRCGHRLCHRRHTLDAWVPTQVKLWAFAASAVKGPSPIKKKEAAIAPAVSAAKEAGPAAKPRIPIKVTSFTQGMAFAYLATHGWRTGRIRVAKVEWRVCGCGDKYQGASCPQCRVPFDPGLHRRVEDDRLILVGAAPPLYSRQPRLRCGACGNLYEPPGALAALVAAQQLLADDERLESTARATHRTVEGLRQDLRLRIADLKQAIADAPCPLGHCGGTPTQRPSHVWVRVSAPDGFDAGAGDSFDGEEWGMDDE